MDTVGGREEDMGKREGRNGEGGEGKAEEQK